MKFCLLILLVAFALQSRLGAAVSADLSQSLRAVKSFRVFNRVRDLPPASQDLLRRALDQEKLAMAEPNEKFRTGDAIVVKKGEQTRPVRRLIFGASSETLRLFYYEVGGYGGGGATVLIFQCDGGRRCKLTWSGVEFPEHFAKTPRELIDRVLKNKVEEFDRR